MTTYLQTSQRLAVLTLLSFCVFGCGWFGDDQPVEKDPNDYLQAEPEPDLQVPADLVSRPDLDPFPGAANPDTTQTRHFIRKNHHCPMRCMRTTRAMKCDCKGWEAVLG